MKKVHIAKAMLNKFDVIDESGKVIGGLDEILKNDKIYNLLLKKL